MSNIKFGRYYSTTSDIHKMNPVYKLICLIIFSSLLLLVNDVVMVLIISILTIILMLASNVPIKLYLNNIRTIFVLIIFIIFINTIFRTPLINTIISTFKLILVVVYTSVVTFTTTPNEMTYGLERILYPLRKLGINTSYIAVSISLAIRFIPIIFEQGDKVLKSQASRGLDFNNGDLKTKIKSLTSILLPMFMLSFKRADSIADFMEVRLYNIEKSRCLLNVYEKRSFDDLVIFSHILIIFVYILRSVII